MRERRHVEVINTRGMTDNEFVQRIVNLPGKLITIMESPQTAGRLFAICVLPSTKVPGVQVDATGGPNPGGPRGRDPLDIAAEEIARSRRMREVGSSVSEVLRRRAKGRQ